MTSVQHGSLKTLRQANRARLLSLLVEHGSLHRAELARLSALSRTTVSNITNDLIARQVLIESETRAAARDGRAREFLAINPRAGTVAGIGFTRERTWVHLADLAHHSLASEGIDVPLDQSWQERVDGSLAELDKLLAQHDLPADRLVGLGVAVPGPISVATGSVGRGMPGQIWTDVNVAEEFRKRRDVEVYVDNNTRLSGIAEFMWGAGRGVPDMLYVGLSTGVGSCMVLDGRVYRGAVGAAGELGHVSVDPRGPACNCGNRGCLIKYATVQSVMSRLEPVLEPDATITDVLEAARAGDRACQGALVEAGEAIGVVLANLCNVLNPGRIVVGGELGEAGELLLAPIRANIQRFALSAVRDVEVVGAELDVSERTCALGGVAQVLRDSAHLPDALDKLIDSSN